jgi:hypothetical protein
MEGEGPQLIVKLQIYLDLEPRLPLPHFPVRVACSYGKALSSGWYTPTVRKSMATPRHSASQFRIPPCAYQRSRQSAMGSAADVCQRRSRGRCRLCPSQRVARFDDQLVVGVGSTKFLDLCKGLYSTNKRGHFPGFLNTFPNSWEPMNGT